MSRRTPRMQIARPWLAAFSLFLGLAACDGSPTGTASPPPSPPLVPAAVTVSPDTLSLRVRARSVLSAKFHPSKTGQTAPPTVWTSLSPEVASVSPDGTVEGLLAGTALIEVRMGEARDTARVTVLRTAARLTVSNYYPRLYPTDTLTLSAVIFDYEDQPWPEAVVEWVSLDTTRVVVSSTGQLTARTPGSARVEARYEHFVGPVQVEVVAPVVPAPCTDPAAVATLAPGEVREVSGADAARLCLGGSSSGAEYALVALNGQDAGEMSLSFYGEGLVTATSHTAAAAPLRPLISKNGISSTDDNTFHRQLRTRERRELSASRIVAARQSRLSGRRMNVSGNLPVEGSLVPLNVSSSCSGTADGRMGRIVAVTRHAVVVVDTANPASAITDAEYRSFGDAFDQVIYNTGVENFGHATDIDANERVVIFYTRAVNELTPAGANWVVQGFHWAGDLVPRSACAGSNQQEMFYMLAPDPRGVVNGNARSENLIRSETLATIAHELQHLINASRRIYITGASSLEEVWLNEGLSHIAEELTFYRASGLRPGGNLDVGALTSSEQMRALTSAFVMSNLSRLERFIRAPGSTSPYASNDELATRGAIWSFLRYAADRRGMERDFWHALVNSTKTGRANLSSAIGTESGPWIRDWEVSLLLDDLGTTAPRYRNPSWHYRSVFASSGGYALKVSRLDNVVSRSVSVSAGGAEYLTLNVSAYGVGMVNVRSGGTTPPPAFHLVVVRMK